MPEKVKKSFEKIDQIYEEMKTKLSQDQAQFNQMKENFGLKENEVLVWELLEEARYGEITSKQIGEIVKEIEKPNLNSRMLS